MGKPTFLCIGGQRCGTTRLHRVLDAHPLVSMTQAGVDAMNKEIHYLEELINKAQTKQKAENSRF